MIYLYSILSILCFVLLLPYFAYQIFIKRKYTTNAVHRFVPPAVSPKSDGKLRILVHAVSVGEVEAAHPIVRRIRQEFPETELIISTVTETGNAVAGKKIKDADLICYFPLDLPVIVPRFISRIKPDIILITETEIWPYFIHTAWKQSIPIIMINGRISQHSFRMYSKIKFFLKPLLNKVSQFLMQSSADSDRIIQLGAPEKKVINGGNVKFDQVIHSGKSIDKNLTRKTFGIPPDLKIIVAGSTHPQEEEIFIESFLDVKNRGIENLLPVIAPRHINRIGDIEEILIQKGCQWIKRTDYKDENSAEFPQSFNNDIPFFILDTIGELAQFYAIAELVYVGGTFVPKGGHNIMEPAIFGVPVCFGPHMENFAEIRKIFLEENAGAELLYPKDMTEFFISLLNDPEKGVTMGQNALNAIRKYSGATEKTFSHIEPWIMKKIEP